MVEILKSIAFGVAGGLITHLLIRVIGPRLSGAAKTRYARHIEKIQIREQAQLDLFYKHPDLIGPYLILYLGKLLIIFTSMIMVTIVIGYLNVFVNLRIMRGNTLALNVDPLIQYSLIVLSFIISLVLSFRIFIQISAMYRDFKTTWLALILTTKRYVRLDEESETGDKLPIDDTGE
jgi:hypothetical protein